MNKQASLNSLIKSACQELLDEEIAYIESLDYLNIDISRKADINFKRTLNRVLFKSSKICCAIKKVSVICVLIFALFVGTIIFVEPVRARVWELVSTWFNDYIKIEIKNDNNTENDAVEELGYPQLEDGWIIEDGYRFNKLGSYVLKSTNGERIFYTGVESNADNYFDNSSHLVDELLLNNGMKAYLFTYENGNKILIWKNRYIYKLQSTDVESDVLIKVANSIEK